MDIVFIEDLRVEATIGVYAWERKIKQTLAFNLEMATDIRPAAEADDLDLALNYKAVAETVQSFVEDSEFLLVETLAEKVAERVMSEFDVPWISLTLHKPSAVAGSRSVGVKIERGER